MAINFINGKPGDGMKQYIVFQQFLDQNNEPLGGGQASNPVSLPVQPDFIFTYLGHPCRVIGDRWAWLSSFYSPLSLASGSLRQRIAQQRFLQSGGMCSFFPQVSVICLSKTIGAA